MIENNLKNQIVSSISTHIEHSNKIEINLWQFYIITIIIFCLTIIILRYVYNIFIGIKDIIVRIRALLAPDTDDSLSNKKKKKKNLKHQKSLLVHQHIRNMKIMGKYNK